MKKTLEECKREVAVKYKLGRTLVMGHLSKYWEEAAYLYADQFYSREEVIRLIDKGMRDGYNFSDAMCDACSITEYAETNYRESFDKFISENLKK